MEPQSPAARGATTRYGGGLLTSDGDFDLLEDPVLSVRSMTSFHPTSGKFHSTRRRSLRAQHSCSEP